MNSLDIVIGANSQTGEVQFEDNLANGKPTIGTSRKESYNFSDGVYTKTDTGLSLDDKNKMVNCINDIVIGETGKDVLITPKKIDITFHAMSMDRGFNSNYPKDFMNSLSEVISDYRDGLVQKTTAILISYDHEGTNTYYPAAPKKKEVEGSFLDSFSDEKKIVDLEIFDSPSSKRLGLTFLGVVGNFINFLESLENDPSFKNIQKQIQDFLGDDYNCLIKLFKKYPLKGELNEGQLSQKELQENGELDFLINKTASDIDFAKLSYISGIISELYLELAMTILDHNRDEILNDSGNTGNTNRFSLDWETIGEAMKNNLRGKGLFNEKDGIYVKTLEELLKTLTEKLEKKLDPKIDENKVTNLVYIEDGYNYEVSTLEDGKKQIAYTRDYIFNINHLDTIKNHFGIIPLFMKLNLITNSGILNKGESIKSIREMSMIFTGSDIVLMREGNRIKIVNRDNPREVFSEIEVNDKLYSLENPSVDGLKIENDEDNDFNDEEIKHREEWYKDFTNSIPKSIGKIPVLNPSSAIIEYIGFQLYDGLFRNQENAEKTKGMFKGAKRCDFTSLKGIFGKVETTYISPIFRSLVEEDRSPIVRITNLAYLRGPISTEVETIDKFGNLLCRHKFIIA
ncbi:MAG: hypothetical protein QM490_02410 [Candidatus Gracilibacteria bacterium]